jgi:nickel-dependent lactate racemase
MVKIPYGSKLIDMDVKGKLLRGEKGKSEGENEKRDVIKHALRNPVNTKRLRELMIEKKEKISKVKVIKIIDSNVIYISYRRDKGNHKRIKNE